MPTARAKHSKRLSEGHCMELEGEPSFLVEPKNSPRHAHFSNGHEKNFFEPQKNFLATPFLPTKIFRFFKTKNLGKKLRSCTQKKVRTSLPTQIFSNSKKISFAVCHAKSHKKRRAKKPFSNGKNG